MKLVPKETVRLKNGNIPLLVLMFPPSPGECKVGVVLAYSGGVEPYVVHRMDYDGNCFWGHYNKTLEEGVKEFQEIVNTELIRWKECHDETETT